MDALPPNFAAEWQEMKRQLAVQQRANKLLLSTITGGTLRVLDSSGNPIAEIGDIGHGNGLLVKNAAGNAILDANDQHGLQSPWVSTAWRAALTTGNPRETTVTSGSMTTVYSTLTELMWADQLIFRVLVSVDAATTGEMQVLENQTSTVIGNVKSLPANTSQALYVFRIAHGLTLGTGPFDFRLQARRTSGAGNVVVQQPWPMFYGSNMTPVSGGW